MNSTRAVAVNIHAVSPEFKAGASSANAGMGAKATNRTKSEVIIWGILFLDINGKARILLAMDLNS
jgi:hypothetical protein